MRTYMTFPFIMLYLLGTSPACAAMPSFECKAAKTRTEKAICANDNLAILDTKIANAYNQLIKIWADGRKNGLISGQKTWLRLRDKACEAAAQDEANDNMATYAKCLENVMSPRLRELETSVKNPKNEVTFLQPIALKDFPYKGHVIDPDIEKLLDLTFSSLDNDFTFYTHSSETVIHSCREGLVYSQAGWSASGRVPYSVEESFAGILNEICSSIEILRTTHPVKRSFLPSEKSLIDISRYGASFFDQPWGATQDYIWPKPNPNEKSFGDKIREEEINVIPKSEIVGMLDQPDDEIWVLAPQKKLSVTFIYNQIKVTLTPTIKAAFDSAGLEEVLLQWVSAMGHSGYFGGTMRVTVLKRGGAIVDVTDHKNQGIVAQ